MTENDRIRCDVCGRFVSLDDLTSGAAIRSLVAMDSYYSTEDYETLCRDHYLQPEAETTV